jgi:hypothetical protein
MDLNCKIGVALEEQALSLAEEVPMTLDSAMSRKKRHATPSCIYNLANVELLKIRKYPRKIFSKLAYLASGNKYYEGIIKNLSHSGAFIETKTKFSYADEIKLVIPGQKKYILLKCTIIYFNQTGFGVKFKKVLKIVKPPETIKPSKHFSQ